MRTAIINDDEIAAPYKLVINTIIYYPSVFAGSQAGGRFEKAREGIVIILFCNICNNLL
ncbi:MAG: hypothetical protein LBJ38_01140 [Oscillospiraceae bacterium]|nr:hypothetical protein [Oscillospiraceae bacterium]